MGLGERAGLRFTNLVGFNGEGIVYFDAAEAVVLNRFDGADVDGNDTMDMLDIAAFQRCFTGENVTPIGWPCLVFDTDLDDDIDLNDWAALDPEARQNTEPLGTP